MKGEFPHRMGTSKDLAEFQALVSAVKKIKVGKGLESNWGQSGQRKVATA